MQDELESTQSYQTTLADNIENTRRRLAALEQQIDGTPAYKQIRSAEAQKDRQDAIRKAGNIEAKPIFDALSALRDAVLKPGLPGDSFPGHRRFSLRLNLAERVIGTYGVDWPKAPSRIANVIRTIPGLSAAQKQIEEDYQEAAAEKARLAKEARRDRTSPHQLARWRHLHVQGHAGFPGRSGPYGRTRANACPKWRTLRLALSPWRGVIESILGDWVDAVIVEPALHGPGLRPFRQPL